MDIGKVSLVFVLGERKDKMLSLGEGQKVQRSSFGGIALNLRSVLELWLFKQRAGRGKRLLL